MGSADRGRARGDRRARSRCASAVSSGVRYDGVRTTRARLLQQPLQVSDVPNYCRAVLVLAAADDGTHHEANVGPIRERCAHGSESAARVYQLRAQPLVLVSELRLWVRGFLGHATHPITYRAGLALTLRPPAPPPEQPA